MMAQTAVFSSIEVFYNRQRYVRRQAMSARQSLKPPMRIALSLDSRSNEGEDQSELNKGKVTC
jgi:hypothetical protein